MSAAALLASVVSAGPDAPTQANTASAAQLVRVPGNVHRLAQPRYDIGEAPSSLKMSGLSLVLAKTPAQQTALTQFLKRSAGPEVAAVPPFPDAR